MNERYPRKLVVENLKQKNTRKSARPNNLATTSQTSSRINPANGKFGIDVGEWITWAINEGVISISGADTHAFNTALTSTANLVHTVGPALVWTIKGTTLQQQIRFSVDDDDIFLISNAGSVALGDVYGDNNGNTIYVMDDSNLITMDAGPVNVSLNDTLATIDLNPGATATAKVRVTTRLNITPITVAVAATLTPAEGDIIMVSDTDGTFTSIGLWGYQNGAWAKV